MLKKCDFVIAIEDGQDVVKNAVDVVRDVDGDYLIVFFVGVHKSIKIHNSEVKLINIEHTGKTRTGKTYPQKICNICHILKDNKDFELNQTSKGGRSTSRPSCKKCRIAINGAPMTKKAAQEFKKLRPKKGSLFTCPLCQKTTIAWITANPVRDHDHKTGEARAWICDSCNTGLGRFQDDIKVIDRLKKYLLRFK